MNPELPRNRLGLARWMMSRDNPLTARVTVNRIWSYLFGLGIVETTEDFGVMGSRPIDQDLLDWLAVEFMDSKWDFRHVVKLMVMSSTYRQSEAISAVKLEKDPLNKLCSRGPHIRLDAEEIRDQALAASGLLVQKLGGPPVKPYQPEGVWEAVAMKDSNTRVYVQDKGEALYRRSLYTFWKRAAPPPALEILNAPSREVSCTRRDRTDTPLQAFVTMNDPQYLEAARQLAARAISQGENFDARLDAVTEPLLTCEPVLAEAAFHLGSVGLVLEMIFHSLLSLSFDCNDHLSQLAALAKRYKDRQPDLADLCVVRMSELYPKHSVITVDAEDFAVYRRNKREIIPLICPPRK